MSRKKNRKPKRPAPAALPRAQFMEELLAIVERTQTGALGAEDRAKLKTAMTTLTLLTEGEVYTAPAPEGVGDEKYDATTTSMIGLLKYGTGWPFIASRNCRRACASRCRRPRNGIW